MVNRNAVRSLRRQAGATAIEILVTLVVVSLGLLGIAGLQMRLQNSEVESYQRSQALLLLTDMAARINANRNNAASYAMGVSNPVGAGMTCPTDVTTTRNRDVAEWCNAIQGASELVTGTTTKTGALIGGRGCIEAVDGEYLITVVWQGLTPVSAPPVSVGCAANAFDGAGTPCVNDLCRRWMTTVVRVADLS